MSLTLDALRRRRNAARAPAALSSPTRRVPAGLGLVLPPDSSGGRIHPQRRRLVVLGSIVVLFLAVGGVLYWISGNVIPPPAGVVSQRTEIPTRLASEPAATTAPVPEPGLGTREPAIGRPEPLPVTEVPYALGNDGSQRRQIDPSVSKLDSAVDHFDRALRYQNLGDFERAREHYLAALGEDEFNVEARNNLGLLYYTRGMTNDAIDEFRRATAIRPTYLKARGNLSVVLMNAGRLAEARAELRTALELAPQDVDLLVNRALVEREDQHPEQAIEILVRAIGISTAHAAAHYNLAVLYDERGLFALAVSHYNSFLKYAGPEYASVLADVQRRVRLIESSLQSPAN